MLKPGKYLSGKKCLYRFVAENKKQRIMKHRQFKTECICMVTINGKTSICNGLREVKRKIYIQGIRGTTYRVDIVEKNTGKINDIYLMKYTKEGPIFQKQTYSRWKEEQAKAKAKQLTITALL